MVIFTLPTIASTVHEFLNHEHTICVSKDNAHLHQKELNCDLHILKQSPFFYTTNSFKIIKPNIANKLVLSKYKAINTPLLRHFNLRGPPQL